MRLPDSEPRRPILSVSPAWRSADGSPTTHQSIRVPRALSVSTTRRVPSTAGPSSSLVIRKAIEPGWSRVLGDEIARSRSPWPRCRSSCRPRRARRARRRGCRAGTDPSARPRAGRSAPRRCARRNTTAGPDVPRRAQRLSTAPKRSRSTLEAEALEPGGDQLLAAGVVRRQRAPGDQFAGQRQRPWITCLHRRRPPRVDCQEKRRVAITYWRH